MRVVAVAVSFCALLVAVPAAAVDRVVDDNLVTCLSGRPLHATIGAAVAAAAPGETILVCPGNYLENVVVDKAGLTLRGQGIVRLSPGSLGSPGIAVQADDVTVQGFDISGYRFACGVSVEANRADVRDNRSHHNGSGICVVTGTGHRLRYNVTEVNEISGIRLSDASADIGNNTTKDNTLHGIVAGPCAGSVTIDHNAAIENHGNGIYAIECGGPTITHNTVRGTGYIGAGNSAGIVVELGQDALVKLNLVTDAVTGVLLTGTLGATATFNSISFNDFGLDVMGSNGVTVTRNNVSRSPIVDCRWDGAGANVLTNNSCGTQQPPGVFD